MELKWVEKVYSDGEHNAFTGLTLTQTVFDTDDVEVTGLTKSFTELGGGDYACLIEGLVAGFNGYVVGRHAAGAVYLATATIWLLNVTAGDSISIEDNNWSMT